VVAESSVLAEGLTRILRDDSYRTAARRLAAEIADLPPVSGSADVLVRAALDG
jgi:UDP:flavonoid glycosyltransferase YjiC (YdhE family)